MLYREGYCCERGVFPSHVSSEKQVSSPLPTVKDLRLKKNHLSISSNRAKKGGSIGFVLIWDSDFE
jgi:hypothetical protein